MYCSSTASASFSNKQGDDNCSGVASGRLLSVNYMNGLACNKVKVKQFDDTPIGHWRPAIKYHGNSFSHNQTCLTSVVPFSVWEQSQKLDAGTPFVPKDDLLECYRHILGFIDKTR